MASPHPQPIVVVSQCLGFAAVRYNGVMLDDTFVQALRRHVQFVQVCPEVGVGLGVPRDPIRIAGEGDRRRLVQPSTRRDLTLEMNRFAASFLDSLGPVDGFILKSRSPSCGIKDVKWFHGAETDSPLGKTTGFFATAVLDHFPHAAIEDEGRLTNFRLRHHFLTKLYALARWRAAKASGTIRALVEFQTEYKLLLMAYSPGGLKALGRVVANPDGLPAESVFDAYRERLGQVMAQPARPSSWRNALQHAFGYVSGNLGARERKYFLELLEEYRLERAPLNALLAVLRAWSVRFEEPYLEAQRLFDPYPSALIDFTDSARVACA